MITRVFRVRIVPDRRDEFEEKFADVSGESWHQAVVPPGMEVFIEECRVHHYVVDA